MRTLLGLVFFSVVQNVAAQDYPAREIRSICNFSAGSGADIVVRYYSDQLAKLAGKPVIVENRPGAQGAVASAFVAKSAPDGYTIHITPASSTLATAPHIWKQLPYDPLKDFATVTTINSLAFVVAVDASKPFKTVQDLISSLKQKPGHGFYGTQSNSGQVAAELLKSKSGLDTAYVPFKVTGEAFTSLLAGQIDFMSVDATWASNQPKVRILAVTSAKRTPSLPNVPTLAEAGVPGIEVYSWQAFVAPKGLPQNVKDRLQPALIAAIKHPDVVKRFNELGFEVVGNSPAEFQAFLNEELARWKQVVESGGIKQTD